MAATPMSLFQDLNRQRHTLFLVLVMVLAGVTALGLAHLFHRDGTEAEHQAMAEKGNFQSRLARMA